MKTKKNNYLLILKLFIIFILFVASCTVDSSTSTGSNSKNDDNIKVISIWNGDFSGVFYGLDSSIDCFCIYWHIIQ